MPLSLLTVLMALATSTPPLKEAGTKLLVHALSCQIGEGEVATLMSGLASEDAGMKSPVQLFALPTGNLYRLNVPVRALGYSTDRIYVAPGRIAMVVSGASLATVSSRLRLAPIPYSPAERRIDGARKIIAYQLHQGALAGRILVGCEYDDPAAAKWFADDAAGL